MAVRTGLEPVISRVTGERDNHYTNEPWLRESDLNQQPLGYEPSELPDCSIPRYYIKVAEEKGFEPLRRFLDLPVFKTGPFNQTWVFLHKNWCPRPESNRHGLLHPQDFKSCASTYSATKAHLVSRWGFEPQTP